jgi:hypothetical protein
MDLFALERSKAGGLGACPRKMNQHEMPNFLGRVYLPFICVNIFYFPRPSSASTLPQRPIRMHQRVCVFVAACCLHVPLAQDKQRSATTAIEIESKNRNERELKREGGDEEEEEKRR